MFRKAYKNYVICNIGLLEYQNHKLFMFSNYLFLLRKKNKKFFYAEPLLEVLAFWWIDLYSLH